MSESKLFKELFVVFVFGNFWGTFLLEFGLFLERGGGNDQIPNILRNLYSLSLDVFLDILGRMTKIQTC